MRILQLHSDFIKYKPIRKEIELAEDAEKAEITLKDIVVLFASVEVGDNENVAKRAIKEVKLSLDKLKANRVLIYPYAHLSNSLAQPMEALSILRTMERLAKEEGIETYRTPFGWCKQFSISTKGHPLAEQSKIILPEKTKEKEKRMPSWKIPKPEYLILTVDGRVALPEEYRFENDELDLKILVNKEVFKKETSGGEPRILRVLKKVGFEWEPNSDIGHMRYGPKASLMVDLVGDYAWESVKELGIPSFSIKGTNLFNVNLPAIKEHSILFGERQYIVPVDNHQYVLRYAACFQQFSMLADWSITYKQIPLGMFEIADSYRLERSGECLLGFRLRRFYMPDYHVLCKEIEQAKEITLSIHRKIHEKAKELGNQYVSLYNLTQSFFDDNRDFMKELIKADGKPALLHFVPEKKYYWVINVEYHITDELKRSREIATVQIDIGNAKRFGIEYTNDKNKQVHPLILHTAVLGGVERYIYMVLDTALKQQRPSIPLWLAPIQIRIIPISDKFQKDAEQVADKLEQCSIRVDIDDRPMTLPKKIREAETEWINYILVIGKKEIDSGIIPVRDRGTGKIEPMALSQLIENITLATKSKPYRKSTLPRFLSKRPQH